MRTIRSFAWLSILALPISSFGSIFQVVQLSEPAGFLSQADAIHQGTNHPSVSPTLSSNGYAFGYWTINDVRVAGPDGRSLTQVSSVIQAASTYKAHYFQESTDSDSDGIMDWFEYRMFGDLSRGPGDDPDGDGFTNQREDQLAQDPLVKDLIRDGGLSSRASTAFVYADTSMVKATINSDPAGFVTQSENFLALNSNVSTASLNGETNGYHFAYWSVNGVRQAAPNGTASSQVDLNVSVTSEIVAHYLPSNEDSDSDGVMDWFELNQFGSLTLGPNDDPDGDGFSNKLEGELGQEARVKDLVRDGGLSSRTSTAFVYADTSMVQATIKSDPAGFVTQTENFLALNSNVSTASLNGETNGYHFAYWSVNGVRQTAPNGTSASQVDMNLTATSQIVAHYLPSTEDSDSDGVMDWFELHQFGNLTLGPNDDPDGDGFSNKREGELGQEARVKDLVRDGGLSSRVSPSILYFLQVNNPPDGLDLNDTIVHANKPAGEPVGIFQPSDPDDPNGQNAYQLSFLDGNGSTDKNLFTISGMNLLSSASLQVGNYSVNIRVKDDENASFDKNFTIQAIHDPNKDDDNDSLTYAQEQALGTSDSNPDTDGDGFYDGLEFAANSNALVSASAPSANFGLAGWWRFEETNGTTVIDSSGNDRNGTLTGFESNQTQWVTGKIGGGLLLDGIDDMVKTLGYNGIGGNAPRTVSCWVKTTSSSANLVLWGRTATNQRFHFTLESGKVKLDARFNRTRFTTIVNDGQWHHLVIVYPHAVHLSEMKTYIDGSPDPRSGSDHDNPLNTITQNPLQIGTFDGVIDEVRLFDRALPQAEVLQLYSKELSIADTDGDGYSDSIENAEGTDPENNSSFPGTDYRNSDLSGFSSSYQNRKFANFEGTNLAGKMLQNTDFTGANFRNANLSNSNPRNATFHLANLTNANFSGADIKGTDFNNSSLDSTILTGAWFSDSTIWPSGFDFINSGAFGPGVDFRQLDLNSFSASYEKARYANFEGTNLAGKMLQNTDFTGANFRNANLSNSNPRNATFHLANLTNANFSGANISGATFTGAIYDTNTTWPTGFDPVAAGALSRNPPTDLNSTAPLSVTENQPAGTLVGGFTATDPDANATLTYHLVPGTGDGNNSLFTLEANGTLKTATVFDYESNASTYTVRVQAKDEHNATIAGNFTVSLTDDPTDNISQPVALTNANFQTAVNLWFTNQADAIATYGHIRDWNVSEVRIMNEAFKDRTNFNEDIGGWDVSKVMNMNSMFKGARQFNQNLSDWNVSAVKTMNSMFTEALAFNQPIGNWDTSEVKNMWSMFKNAESFNQYIGDWNVSAVTNFGFIFDEASSFNQDLGGWDMSSVTSTYAMFHGAQAFNQNIADWRLSSVTTMNSMFKDAKTFNQDIGAWDTSSVTDMWSMFSGARDFDQNISEWNSTSVIFMELMFKDTPALSSSNKEEIHTSFSSNPNWPYDWSDQSTQSDPGDSNATNPDDNATQPDVPTVELFQPIVETGEARKVQKDSAALRGSLIDNGGARITGRGFLLSPRPNPKLGRQNVIRLDVNGSKNFQAQATNLKPGKKYFYRAFATNAEGTSLGSVESFTTIAGPPSPSWINAQPGTAANWWASHWFGNFYLNANGWARHEQLDWVFPIESPTAGLWLWKEGMGWLWTDKEIYPFLNKSSTGGWLYFYGQYNGTLLFYDYEAKGWIRKQDSQ